MVREAGAEYVIIGHSERRRLFGDTDELVNRRLIAALGAKLTPIVCIGETLEEREGSQTLERARSADQGGARQHDRRADRLPRHRLRAGLGDRHRPERHARAGRRGACAHPSAHAPVVRRPRGRPLPRHLRRAASKPDNTRDLVALPDVDGALVGGASLDLKGFFDIVVESRKSMT